MKYITSKLSRQLLLIIVLAFIIIVVSCGIILPKTLQPVYEKNLYGYLRQPLELVEETKYNPISEKIGYVYIYNNDIFTSENIDSLIKIDKNDLVKIFTSDYGKFTNNNMNYYYYSDVDKDGVKRVVLTDDTYIERARKDVINSIFPVVIVTLIVVAFLLIFWGSFVVRRIVKLKNKVDHIEDDNYDHKILSYNDDEIKTLEMALEDMRINLKNQEEYRNHMYQNISHDFKTPLTVIKSYIEAVDDEVEDVDKALPIIKQQVDNLEYKVHSLLYLNKLDYIKDMNLLNTEQVDLMKIIKSSTEKFKHRNEKLEFIVDSIPTAMFYGTTDTWETIIDNILNNGIRYANNKIKITVKKNQLIIYNDGPNIDPNLVEDLFNPFRKGIKGEFGLGLSIVEKTLRMMGYSIEIKNHNKYGVSFIITKKNY